MTLETGQWSLKTDVSPPKVIVSRPSHPFSPCTQLFHTRNETAGCGERAQSEGQGSVEGLWEIPGREVLKEMRSS